jgi:hypothetical protein
VVDLAKFLFVYQKMKVFPFIDIFPFLSNPLNGFLSALAQPYSAQSYEPQISHKCWSRNPALRNHHRFKAAPHEHNQNAYFGLRIHGAWPKDNCSTAKQSMAFWF